MEFGKLEALLLDDSMAQGAQQRLEIAAAGGLQVDGLPLGAEDSQVGWIVGISPATSSEAEEAVGREVLNEELARGAAPKPNAPEAFLIEIFVQLHQRQASPRVAAKCARKSLGKQLVNAGVARAGHGVL